MKIRYIFILTITLLLSLTIKAQDEKTYYYTGPSEFEVALTQNLIVTSGKSITLKPGFSTDGFSFNAKIQENLYEFDYNFEQMNDKNYSRIIIPKAEVKFLADLNYMTTDQVYEEITYTDGLGRALQKQIMGITDQGEHMIQVYSFDEHGRQDIAYLPFVEKTESEFLTDAKTKQLNFYNNTTDKIADDASPFGEVTYENSPMSRITESGSVGTNWQLTTGNTSQANYQTNASGTVRKWIYSAANNNYVGTGYYPAGSLYKTTITDENDKTVISYTDGNGRTVLKDQEGLQTYYIYDYYGRLAHILPPEFIEQMASVSYIADTNDQLMKDYCYTYIYGERSLLIEKKLPGDLTIEYVYDKLNRPVLSRNNNLKEDNKWSFIKYDKLGRTFKSGLWTDPNATPNTRASLQTTLNTQPYLFDKYVVATEIYSGRVFPNTNLDVHILNYYDSYPSFSNTYMQYTGYDAATSNVLGMLTYSKVKILDGSGNFLESTFFYDEKGHLLQKQNENIFNKVDISTYKYSFIGQIEKLFVEHEMPDGLIEAVTKYYHYDKAGRLLSVEQEIEADATNGKVKMLEMEYNKLGQVTAKKLHETAPGDFLQNIDYKYNIRGWLTKMNDPDNQGADNDLFAMRLHYNDVITQGAQTSTAMQNGLISSMEWNVFGNSPQKRAYSYEYDNHYRLTNAHYSAGNSLADEIGRYDVTLSYYSNGKIKTLKRNGLKNETANTYGLIDDLTYTYNGNKLIGVSDAVVNEDVEHTRHFRDMNEMLPDHDEYNYDNNGNMIFDYNKQYIIEYNHLNKPTKVKFDSQNYITFVYDALGNKLSKNIVKSNAVIDHYDFVGSFIYQNNALSQIATDEGRVTIYGTTYSYEYFLRDHLSSVRVMFKEGTSGEAELLQENHYYPFGMRIAGLSSKIETNNTLFGGKELINEQFDAGVDQSWYDFGARMYDQQLGLWFNPDPMMEKYHSTTPYNYCLNNPVNFTDPTGMDPVWWDTETMGDYGKNVHKWGMHIAAGGGSGGGGGGGGSYGPGQGENGTGLNGYYYDWYTRTYRYVSGEEANFVEVNNNAIVPNSLEPFGYFKLGDDGKEIPGSRVISGYNVVKKNAQSSGLTASLDYVGAPGGDPTYYLYFDGNKLMAINENTGNVDYSTLATSGKGEHMNNPNSQNLQNVGPIPEGLYIFNTSQWNSQSTLRQTYNILRGNGDWGDYNVPLTPISYQGSRNSFYLHGGFYEGSAGCIDAGGNVGSIYNLLGSQGITFLRVKY